jgi:hypothetical protein
LHSERGVRGCKARGEELEGGGGVAHVAEEEVGQDGAGGVGRCGVGVVGGVPIVLEVCEEGRRLFCAEEEVTFGIVDIVFGGIK